MWWTISPISSMCPTIATERPVAGSGHARDGGADRVVGDLGERGGGLAEHGRGRLLVARGPGRGQELVKGLWHPHGDARTLARDWVSAPHGDARRERAQCCMTGHDETIVLCGVDATDAGTTVADRREGGRRALRRAAAPDPRRHQPAGAPTVPAFRGRREPERARRARPARPRGCSAVADGHDAGADRARHARPGAGAASPARSSRARRAAR